MICMYTPAAACLSASALGYPVYQMATRAATSKGGAARPRLAPPARKPPQPRHRRLICDCGRPATSVKLVIVGTDPQYTIRLPLCPECLKLEQEME
jgi:hypothetical protein